MRQAKSRYWKCKYQQVTARCFLVWITTFVFVLYHVVYSRLKRCSSPGTWDVFPQESDGLNGGVYRKPDPCLYRQRSPHSNTVCWYSAYEYRSQIHERTISLRFLGIILSVLRFEVSVYNVYIINQFKPVLLRGDGPLVEVTVNSKKEKSFVPITSKNSASGLALLIFAVCLFVR